MAFWNMGDYGWLINNDENVEDTQQEKEDAIAYATERLFSALKEVSRIYSEYGNIAMFKNFQDAVFETMQKADHENYFNDENYKNTDQKDWSLSIEAWPLFQSSTTWQRYRRGPQTRISSCQTTNPGQTVGPWLPGRSHRQ